MDMKQEMTQASEPAASVGAVETDKTSLSFHLKTIWLFTRNDLISMILPQTAFGIFSALTGPLLTTNQSPRLSSILLRLPHVILWLWLNLLVFCIANQRLPDSIQEDSINKPWRPLPSKRLTPLQARRLLLVAIPATCLASQYLGAVNETMVLTVLTWIYNDLGAADEGMVLRNFVNALGVSGYGAGAVVVACGPPGSFEPNRTATHWLIMMGLMIFTTMQVQDLYDQEGDAARGRKTAPLVLGDRAARWTLAVPVTVLSLVSPAFWRLSVYGYVFPVLLGGVIVFRTLMVTGVKADLLTFKLWCFWGISLYALPLVKDHSVFYRF